MTKTKDGFYKDYGVLSDNYVLLAAGGHKKYGNETDNIPISNGTMNVDLFAEYAQKFKPLYEQTYIYTCTSNNDANGYIFFGNVKPTSGYWQEPWEIYYTLVVNTPNANCQGVYDVIISAAGTTITYHIYNRFYSTSYRPIYNHILLWHDSQSKYNNKATYPAKIGVRVRDAYNVTSLQRTYNIKVWKLTNCEFEFPSNVELRGSVYNSTNYALTQLNGTDVGLQETGDINDTTTMQLCYSRLQAGANGIKQYSLIMQDGTGKWQSFTSGSGTGTNKAKNTSGFRLGSRIYYVSRGSDLAANGYLDNSNVRTYQALIDFRYTLNITANSLGNGLTYNKPIFIVGKINETDGLFYLNDTWWTQDEPTSEDGNIYIRVAEAVYPDYNISSMPTGNYRADFLSDGYAFYYTEGKIKKYGSGDSNYRLYIGAGNAASSALVTNPYIKLFFSTKLKDQYQIIGSGATTVQSDNNGNITISSTDNKVTQTLIDSSNTNSRPLIIGYSSSNANPRSFASTTNTVYATYNMYVDPTNGRLTLYALNNLFIGTGTVGTTSGSNYIPAKWTYNKGIIPKDGDIFTIKMPVAGHDYGVFISLNNGTNYYPVILNGTDRLTTQYPNGIYLLIVFEETGKATSIFPVAGGTSRTTVSGGAFRVLNYYNTTDTQNMYLPYSQLKAGTSGIKENSLVMQAGDGTWQSFTTNNGVGTSKSKNTTGFRLGSRIYYTSNGNIAANSNMGTWVLRAYVANIDFRYSTNCGTTLTAKKPLYIVGTINTSNGLFYLDDTWWTQTEPTSANGKIYIRVCEATYNTYQGDLVSDGYAFWFKNGKFQRYGLGTAEDIPKALISKGTTVTTTAGEVYGIAGNTTSGSRIPTRWFVNLDNGDKTLKDGMIISLRLPTAGLGTVGECLTIDGDQSHFHQIVYNTNSKLTTHFGINSVITLQYDATISCDMYGKFDSSISTYVQNGNTTTSVTGVWRLLTLYDSGNDNNKVTQTATTANANYEILFSQTADNTTRTEEARKTSSLIYNPSTKLLTNEGDLKLNSSRTWFIDYGSTLNHIPPYSITGLLSFGYPVYTDPEFASGTNYVSVYNNTSGGAVTITREASTEAANSSRYQLKIVTNGTASPGAGGFYQTITARANAIFVQIFRAKIPVGYDVATASNTMGTSYKDGFITSTAGTGKWEWYARIVHCGSTGSFANGGHVYLTGSNNTSVTWYVCHCSLIDITKQNYNGLRTRYADDATKLLTSRNLKVNLASSSAQSFNGSADATSIGVSGTLPFANLPTMYWANIAIQSGSDSTKVPTFGSAIASKSNTNEASFQASNSNGKIELLTSTNRGLYDRTKSTWVVGTNGTNTWLSQGNIGIGTDSPGYKLTVNGNSMFYNRVNIDSNTMGSVVHINFNRANYNYINVPTGGTLAISVNGAGGVNTYLAIDSSSVYPGYHNNSIILGTTSYRWKAVYIGSQNSYGSSTKPIYWNSGVPTECSFSASDFATAVHEHKRIQNNYSTRPTTANVSFGDGYLYQFKATSSMTEGKPAWDAHILHFAWDNTGGWDAQLAIGTAAQGMQYRAQNSGTWGNWITLLDTNNSSITSSGNTVTIKLGGVSQSFTPTDTMVTQTATTTNANYEILFSNTADNTTRTEKARKTSTLLYNPSTKLLSNSGIVQGTQLKSTIATGTAPLIIASTTNVTNLNADLLDGYHETDFFRYRGSMTTDYVDLTTYTANATNYQNPKNGIWTVSRSGHSAGLITFTGSGSSSGLDIYFEYTRGQDFKFRRRIDSNRLSGDWETILTNLNYTSYLGYIATTPVKASSTAAQNITGTGNITSNSNNSYNLGSSSLYWNWAYIDRICLNRSSNANYGRIYFYTSTYYTWVDYMSSAGSGEAPTEGKPSTTTEVTSWARRSLIENNAGYGWIWESCANASVSSTTKPSAKMSLSSNTGILRIEANASSTTNNTGGLIVSSVANGSQGNTAIELWRGTNASWMISNEGGTFHIRDNYTTAAQTTYLHDNLQIAYNTGQLKTKEIVPFTTNTYNLGTISLRWNNIYYYGSAIMKMSTDTSNAKLPIQIVNTSDTLIAEIGYHNTGDTNGAFVIVPYDHSGTDFWSGGIGLYIGKNNLKWENKYILRYSAAATSGRVIVSDGTTGNVKTSSYSLSATINSGTTNRMAWYNGANSISAATNIWTNGTKLAINSTSEPTETLYANGDTKVGGDLRVVGNDQYFGSSSGSQCHVQYDNTNKCLNFIFD